MVATRSFCWTATMPRFCSRRYDGDIVEVRSRVEELREKSPRLVHEMVNVETGVVAAICELTGVHMDGAQRRAVPFPTSVRTSFVAEP